MVTTPPYPFGRRHYESLKAAWKPLGRNAPLHPARLRRALAWIHNFPHDVDYSPTNEQWGADGARIAALYETFREHAIALHDALMGLSKDQYLLGRIFFERLPTDSDTAAISQFTGTERALAEIAQLPALLPPRGTRRGYVKDGYARQLVGAICCYVLNEEQGKIRCVFDDTGYPTSREAVLIYATLQALNALPTESELETHINAVKRELSKDDTLDIGHFILFNTASSKAELV